ncbi:WD40-like Beta Propeller Repeat [Nocardioides sp. YR527]|uniref:PD40 domain-containing protein n=1 Tax=Nocardioides sp. YR527 TaxID=1881028 RepID=UPI0008885A58|nr:PD40 domain-containing protein [Nocardioides sp. YR527]SDK97140.1 WD40-like Beta Propeller Repeat [Nocardioides sp. YR527]
MTTFWAKRRTAIFGAIVVLVTAGVTAYALSAIAENDRRTSRATEATTTSMTQIEKGPRILFRHTGRDADYGHVGAVALDDPGGARALTDLSCDRVYAQARSVSCLATEQGVVSRYRATDLATSTPGKAWREVDGTDLPGLPSRTRISPDGQLVSSTVFVNGDSYMVSGFSTRTLIRRVGGASYGDLEKFSLVVDGREVSPVDRNIWGITFADDDRTFYATVATGGRTYLARGDLTERSLTTVADHVECPSLSPDGTRIAFKEADKAGTRWTPAVLDLATGRRTVLAGETHSIDDQIEWLDDDTVLYGLEREGEPVDDVWALDTSASATPRVLIPEAASPAVLR